MIKRGWITSLFPKETLSPAGGFLAIFLALLGGVIAVPVQLPNDGQEFLCTAASLLRTHNMEFEEQDLAAAAEMASPESFVVDFNPEFGQNTRRNKEGVFTWGSHSFYVTAIALPFVFFWGAKGFLVLNAICCVLMLMFVYLHLAEMNPRPTSFLLSCAFVLLSGALSYVFWVNSEMFLMAALCGALYFGLRLRTIPAALLLGVATAVKPPLVFVFIPLAIWTYTQKRSLAKVAVMGLVFFLAGLPQLAFYLHNFGHFQASDISPERLAQEGSPSLAQNTIRTWFRVFKYVSPIRLWAFWLAPGTGGVWFYPAVVWCVVRSRWPAWFSGLMSATVGLVCLFSMVPSNLFSAEAGVRYFTLLFPLFLFLGGKWKGKALDWAGMLFVAFFGGALLIDATHNTRVPQQLFAKTYPSMAAVRGWGLTMYPEPLFHCGYRIPRDVVFDYCDSNQYLRNDKCQLMVRNAESGELVLKVFAGPDYPETTIALRDLDGPWIRADLKAGRVTTLRLPVAEDALTLVAFPDLRNSRRPEVPVARMKLRLLQMHVRSGSGELRWQQRYHARNSFLYCAGPRVLNVYPSWDWILQTLASDELEGGNPIQLRRSLIATDNQVFFSRDIEDCVEGKAAVRLRNANAQAERIDVLNLPKVSLQGPKRQYGMLEIQGWTKIERFERSNESSQESRFALTVNWFDADGYFCGQSRVWAGNEPSNWGLFDEKIPVPEQAETMCLGAVFENATGVLELDDVVVSWFKDTWDTRN